MFKIILLLLIIISCDDLDEDSLLDKAYICQTDNKKRPCNDIEKIFVDNMKAILAQIRSFSFNNWKSFYKKEQNLSGRKVYFFGENHDHAIAQMENLAAINYLSSNNSTILLEGKSRNLAGIRECGINLVFHIYQAWQWEKQGEDYEPKTRQKWLKEQNFTKLYYSTYESFDIKNLNLHKMTCYFWDDIDAIKSKNSIKNLEIRNKSMVLSIENHLQNDPNIPLIIITGLSHMPLGEYLLRSNKKDVYDNYSINNFYKNIPKNFGGTSYVIYEFLYKNSVNYTEFIHKSFLNY